MTRFRRHYTGKPCDYCGYTFQHNDASWAWGDHTVHCHKRIAALESELAATKAKEETSFVSYKTQKARAEKAEAEVERLTGQLRWHHHSDDEGQRPCVCHHYWKAFLHEGDGRGADTSGEASPTRVASPPLCMRCPHDQTYHPSFDHFRCAHVDCTCPGFVAAAEPAAPRHYEDCICVECESARKERGPAHQRDQDYEWEVREGNTKP